MSVRYQMYIKQVEQQQPKADKIEKYLEEDVFLAKLWLVFVSYYSQLNFIVHIRIQIF